jgi:peptidoglycan/LPS O-acetylase OafA/YrhL
MIAHYFSFWIARAGMAAIAHFPALAPAAPPTPQLIRKFATLYPLELPVFGVALFFLVSGFVIPFSFRSYSRVGFLIARILRLYPTYAVGFSLTIASLAAGAAAWHQPFPYSTADVLRHVLPGMRDLLGGPHIDYVVWTLEVEAKFYLVCLLIAPLLRSGSLLVFLVPAAAAILTRVGLTHIPSTSVGISMLFAGPMLIFMFIGVAVHYRYRGLIRNWSTACIVVILLLGFWLLFTPEIYGSGFAFIGPINYSAAAATFILCAALPARLFSVWLLRFAAKISYPLYVIHGVNGYIAMRLMAGIGMAPILCVLTASAVAIGLAYVLHVAIEMPTHRLGQRWGRMLSGEIAPIPLEAPVIGTSGLS